MYYSMIIYNRLWKCDHYNSHMCLGVDWCYNHFCTYCVCGMEEKTYESQLIARLAYSLLINTCHFFKTDTNNTGNVYYSAAKDPYISGNKNINNPLYIEQHDKKVSDKHTYEFMDGPKVPGATASINKTDSMDYQVLYETPVDGVSSGPNNIPQQDIFLGSTQIALDLSGNVQIAKSECKNTKNEGPADYEEPCCASHCTENQYTALDSKAVSSSAIYEMPRNANNNYEEPWKKLF